LLCNTESTGCQHSNRLKDRGSNDAENVGERREKETGNNGRWQSLGPQRVAELIIRDLYWQKT
jgi:hypothetical protein